MIASETTQRNQAMTDKPASWDLVVSLSQSLAPEDRLQLVRLLVRDLKGYMTLDDTYLFINQLTTVQQQHMLHHLKLLLEYHSPNKQTMQGEDAWNTLVRIGKELGSMGPAPMSSTEAISSMRR